MNSQGLVRELTVQEVTGRFGTGNVPVQIGGATVKFGDLERDCKYKLIITGEFLREPLISSGLSTTQIYYSLLELGIYNEDSPGLKHLNIGVAEEVR